MSTGSGNEILFNVEEVPFKPDSTSDGAATRATKLTDISSFKLYAYDEAGTAISNGVTYTKSGDSWNPDSKVFWPQTGNVTFYAFSPASNSSVSFNTTSKTLTYTAPTGESSQQDVLYAYLQASNSGDNTATLTFNHANAAFSVNARLASGCTATVRVSGVSLVNVKPTNTLTFTSGSASASGSNITSALACSAKTLTTSNQAISSSPLIIPPQSVTAWAGNNAISSQTGAYLAVTCKVQSNGTYVVGSSSANGTVYVPMSKALTKGQDNSVNLVFGSAGNNGRYYGRRADGTRIFVSNQIIISQVTTADLGKVLCTDGVSVYNTVTEATAAGKTAAAMIAYVSGTGHGLAIALTEAGGRLYALNWDAATTKAAAHTPSVSGYSWKLPSKDDFNHMFDACGGASFSSSSGAGQSHSYGNFRSMLINCGGTDVNSETSNGSSYWSSTEYGNTGSAKNYAWRYFFSTGSWGWHGKSRTVCYVRPCLAF